MCVRNSYRCTDEGEVFGVRRVHCVVDVLKRCAAAIFQGRCRVNFENVSCQVDEPGCLAHDDVFADSVVGAGAEGNGECNECS